MILTKDLLHEWFVYKEGFLYWKKYKGSGAKIGDRAGSPNSEDNRIQIKFFGKLYKAARLIFLYHKGYLPKNVDHRDRDCTNDKIENLRDASHSQNMFNKPSYKNSSSKFKGVSLRKSSGKWRVRIDCEGVQKHVGYFDTQEEGAKAYNEEAKKLHGEFANLNII